MNILEGMRHQDGRGTITYNNDFDASRIKRIYTIENHSTDFVRGWQGHKVEQRWFATMQGAFEIAVIKLDDFENPSRKSQIQTFQLTDKDLTYLHVHAGCITAIKAKEEGSKLLVLSDYAIGEVHDEYRFALDYFLTRD